ncbi:cytochrome c oxidase subunit I [Faunimonas sp. B44]|uniref:cytochrome c oxidase subunit I n=1 Tax=Faunimonas sp. B44 TaxID=3461493 RepID=UPI004044A6BB
MSEPNPAITPVRLHRQLEAVWGTPRGWPRLSAVNHNIVGKRFIFTSFAFFAIGGVLAMLIRAQLATSHSAFVGPEIYNQIFTMHGSIMMFLFAIPLFEGLAIYMLPKVLGARDLAFPRLSAYGYWCYLFGGTIMLAAMFVGAAPDGGWFMYTPLTSRPYSPGINADVWLIGVTFVEVSAVAAAVEIVVTVLKVRAPGMSLDRMPLLAWYFLVTAFMMVFGFPPLIVGSILLEAERAFDLPFFDPERGGDPLLWQHLFWLFGHPEVYIIFLPAAGVVSTVLPVLARREILGYTWIVVSIIALAFLSFGLWVHHMFTVGIPHLALGFFSAASTAVVFPTAVQIFAWLGTLLSGRPQLKLPMLYLFGFFFIFVIGGLTGVMVAIVPFDWQAHDTHFVVAHMHYVLVGGFVFPMLAGAYYWLPLFTGRAPFPALGKAAFWLIFIGFNLTFFIMHWTGLMGMPRRIYTYPTDFGWDWFNLVSSIGGFLMAMGFALFATDMILQARFGRRERRNNWQAGTLEWSLPRPPPAYNFGSLPAVDSRSPLKDVPALGSDLAAGRGFLGFTRHGWQETIGVEMTSGRADQVLILPRRSYLPLVSAAATGVFFLSFLFKLYPLAALGFAATVASFLLWSTQSGQRRDHGPLPIGNGVAVPPHPEAEGPASWWAMVFALAADATFFASLVFGALFLWVVAPAWPPATLLDGGHLASLAAIAGSLVAAWAMPQAARAAVEGRAGYGGSSILLAVAGQSLASAALAYLATRVPAPTGHAYGAVMLMLCLYAALHAGLGIVFAGFARWRIAKGYVSPRRTADLRIAGLWQAYTALVVLATAFVLHGMPLVMTP